MDLSPRIGLALASRANPHSVLVKVLPLMRPNSGIANLFNAIYRADVRSPKYLLRREGLGKSHKTLVRYGWQKRARNRTAWAIVLIVLAAIALGSVVTWLFSKAPFD